MEKEVDTSWEKGNQVSQLFKVIEKAKKKAEGYEDDATVIFKKVGLRMQRSLRVHLYLFS